MHGNRAFNMHIIYFWTQSTQSVLSKMGFSYRENQQKHLLMHWSFPIDALSPIKELLHRHLRPLLAAAGKVQKGPLAFGDLLFPFCQQSVFHTLNIPSSSHCKFQQTKPTNSKFSTIKKSSNNGTLSNVALKRKAQCFLKSETSG